MASWKDNLRRASFRSIPFLTESYGGEHGRRWADHEYPGRDVPYAEDMGRSQRVWRFTGYLIGDNYPMMRSLLVAACELPGPGPLVHPTIGAVQVVCRKIEHNEERDRGRYVSLQFEFAEAGQLLNPASLSIPASIIAAAALPLGRSCRPPSSATSSPLPAGWRRPQLRARSYRSALRCSRCGCRRRASTRAAHRAITTLVEDSAALAINPPASSLAVDTAFHAFTDAGEATPVVTSMLQFAAPAVTVSNAASVAQAPRPTGAADGAAVEARSRQPNVKRGKIRA
jgi:hypothetical protein